MRRIRLGHDLRECLRTGQVLEIGEDQQLSAELVRDLIIEFIRGGADPRGLQVTGGTFAGPLDLSGLEIPFPVSFMGTTFEMGFDAREASFKRLHMDYCRFQGWQDGEALTLVGTTISQSMFLEGITAYAVSPRGALRLSDLHCGQVSLRSAVIRNDGGPAITADGIRLSSSLHLEKIQARGMGDAAIRLQAAAVQGSIHLEHAFVRNDGNGPAILCQRSRAEGHLLLSEVDFIASGSHPTVAADYSEFESVEISDSQFRNPAGGGISFPSCTVRHNVQIERDRFDTRAPEAIDLTRLKASGDVKIAEIRCSPSDDPRATVLAADEVVVNGSFQVSGLREPSIDRTISMRAAYISQNLLFDSCDLSSQEGTCMDLGSARVGGLLQFCSVELSTVGNRPSLDLAGAQIHEIHGQDVKVLSGAAPGIHLEDCQIEKNLVMRRVIVKSSHNEGAIRLTHSRTSGAIRLTELNVENSNGSAISADGITVGHPFTLSGTCFGTGIGGGFRCVDAVFESQVVLQDLHLEGDSGGVLLASGMSAASVALDDLKVVGNGDHPLVDLTAGKLEGILAVSDVKIINARGKDSNWGVDLLTYSGIPVGVSGEHWLNILRTETPHYSPRAYQQLVSGARGAGDDTFARKVLIRQKDDQYSRKDVAGRERAFGLFLKWTLGYGYQPWRALVGLALFIVIFSSCCAFGSLGKNGLREVVETQPAPSAVAIARAKCTKIERFLYGVEQSLPLVRLDASKRCAPYTTNQAGRTLALASPAMQLLSWSLSTLFVAGFTGLVRRS